MSSKIAQIWPEVAPVESFIDFVNVGKTFRTRTGDIPAICDISLSIPKNQFVAIVGPSGCGKSTLLKMLAGLLTVTSGRIDLHTGGRDPLPNVGMVFQRPALLPWRDVLSNILLPTQIAKLERPVAVKRAMALLKLVGLAEFARKYPNELSGGMQMRVALCRALICEPTLLLMDEPFGALDAMTREELSIELLKIWQHQPKTVLFVTHSISEAILLADRVVVMSARPGRVIQTVDIDISRPRDFSDVHSAAFKDYSSLIRELIGTRH
ncbi:MAG: ABC transporter ATP-binding protein [Proteobacteria bacterium]|nr:ABC transporter ATP-binding protein [Pseudomonadota bacterium]